MGAAGEGEEGDGVEEEEQEEGQDDEEDVLGVEDRVPGETL